MIFWKKTFTISLVEAKASENVRGKFAVASKQNRTMGYGGNLKYYKPQHSELSGFTPRIQPPACGLGLYARFVKPDNSSASVCYILLQDVSGIQALTGING